MVARFILSDLRESLSYFPVVGLIGPRQVGKTTLTKELTKELGKDSLYLDLERPEDLARLSEPSMFLRKYEDRCIILDEIQRKRELFPVLRSVIDEKRIPCRFIITGSASPDLIRDSSESLAGRIAYHELTPFNIMEIKETNATQNHWFRGGFPASFLAPSDRLSKRWLQNFIQTYIERDLPLLGLQVAPSLLRNLWSMLAHVQGSILNMQLLSKSLEITGPTLKSYINFLTEAFLIRTLAPFHANIKKRLVKSPKVYIRDTGILHAILGVESIEQLEGHPIIGASWEGYIIEQIYSVCADRFDFCFYRTHHGAECDLVLTKANTPVAAIEIKYTSAPKVTKGLNIAIQDLKTLKNFIICSVGEDYPIARNITVCNLTSFVKNHLPYL